MHPDVYVQPIAGDGSIPEGAMPALSSPGFIIRDGSAYYVPLALVRYDIDHAQSDAERAGCAAVAARFEAGALASQAVLAVRSPTTDVHPLAMAVSDQQTKISDQQT